MQLTIDFETPKKGGLLTATPVLADQPTHVPLPGPARPIHEVTCLDDYLMDYGDILGKRAIESLKPLHTPGVDPLPDYRFSLQLRPAQEHVVAAAVQMLNVKGSGFICGEMGTGKTYIGMCAVHEHAKQSVGKGGSNGNYRCLVLCPDHLVSKWCRFIRRMIPDATVVRFGPQGDLKTSAGKRGKKDADRDEETNTRKSLRHTLALTQLGRQLPSGENRWASPDGAEYYVFGRNQIKWLSDWRGIAEPVRGFNGEMSEHCLSSKPVKYMTKEGQQLGRVHQCPACGNNIVGKDGVPVAAKSLKNAHQQGQKRCSAIYLKSVFDSATPQYPGGQTIHDIDGHYRNQEVGAKVKMGGREWIVCECREPLYNYTDRPYRWAPANIIQRKLRKLFKYLIIDEAHEQKSDSAGQSMACSKLIGSVKHVLALTGTIIGGYANHMYPLLMRICPESLVEEGFEWGKDQAFSELYGRIKTVVTTKEDDPSSHVAGRSKSGRRAKSGNRNVTKTVEPGVMPTFFGRHIMDCAIFLTLAEMADGLPDLFEYVGGKAPAIEPRQHGETDDDYEYRLDVDRRSRAGWFDAAVDMDPDQKEEYDRVTGIMLAENKELLKNGSMKFLGATLWTGLDYPDRPFGWEYDPDAKKAFSEAVKEGLAAGEYEATHKMELGHTIGYWKTKEGGKHWDNWKGVVTPADLPRARVYPKEQRLVDICVRQKEEGRQTWVGVHMSGKRDIQPRLQKLLQAWGLKVGVLRSTTVTPIEREEWIEAHGNEFDVILSNPELVKTGLDFFSDQPGGHNYSTIVFYETGYNLFTMLQFAHRHWRLGQPLDCRTYYLHYRETMQQKAMQLMSRKASATMALSGQFSEEGLAALAGEDNMQMSLARQLSQRISESDIQRNWPKMKIPTGKKKAAATISAAASLSETQQADVNTATAVQIVLETIEEQEAKQTAAVEELKQVQFFSPPRDDYEDGGSGKEFVDEETGEEYDFGDPGHPAPKLVTCADLDAEDDDQMTPDQVAEIWMKMRGQSID